MLRYHERPIYNKYKILLKTNFESKNCSVDLSQISAVVLYHGTSLVGQRAYRLFAPRIDMSVELSLVVNSLY